jgi:hypothetical protein
LDSLPTLGEVCCKPVLLHINRLLQHLDKGRISSEIFSAMAGNYTLAELPFFRTLLMTTRPMREVIPVTNTLLRRQMCINAARKMMRAQPDTAASELIQKLAKVHARAAVFPAPDVPQ